MNFLFDSAIQNSIVVAAVIVPVILACRAFRNRPAVQHLLWLVVLLKFVTPPFVTWPWSLEDLSATFQLSEVLQARPSNRGHFHELDVEPSVYASPVNPPAAAGGLSAVPNVAATNFPLPATFQFAERVIRMHAVAYGLTMTWVVGMVVCLTVQIKRIRRFDAIVCQGRLGPQALADRVAVVAQWIGVRPPSVFVMSGISSPFIWCFGRSKLLWPESLTDSADLAKADSLIAHELGHLRRYDHWTSRLELVAGIIWWWNPLMAFVRMRLRESAEIACDAMAITAFADQRREYAEFLLDLSSAKRVQASPTPLGINAGTVGFLERRLKLIVSGGVDSRLSFSGGAVVLLIALVAFPGWSFAQPAASRRSLGQVLDIKIAQQGDGPIVTQPKLNDPQKAERRIAGRVIDEKGEPVAGALIYWNVAYGRPKGIAVETTSDVQGRFSCVVPDVAPARRSWRNETLWVFKQGKRLATASTFRDVNDDEKLSNLDIRLEEDVEVPFKVVTSEQEPISGVQLEPWHFLTHLGYGIIPEPIRKLLTTTTDAKGVAGVSNGHKDGLFTLHAISDAFGTQEVRVARSSTSGPEEIIVLQPAGCVEGQLIAKDAALVSGIEMVMTTPENVENPSGLAIITTDNEGRFSVPAIAAGKLLIQLTTASNALEIPRLPSSSILSAGQTLPLKIEFEPSIAVWGTIRTNDTDKPVPGAEISIRYGTWRQGANVVSDANGRFEARVLAGPVYTQVIVKPNEFRNYAQVGEFWTETIDVPEAGTPFELPSIRLVPLVRIEGKIVLPTGAPAAKIQVNGLQGNRRYGRATTNELGEFEMRVPQGITIEKYQIWTERTGPPQDIEVEEGAPLILQLK